MKGLILLVNGFEESEAIITIDLLRRANIEIDLVSLTNSLTVTSSGNITVSCDKLYSITKLMQVLLFSHGCLFYISTLYYK